MQKILLAIALFCAVSFAQDDTNPTFIGAVCAPDNGDCNITLFLLGDDNCNGAQATFLTTLPRTPGGKQAKVLGSTYDTQSSTFFWMYPSDGVVNVCAFAVQTKGTPNCITVANTTLVQPTGMAFNAKLGLLYTTGAKGVFAFKAPNLAFMGAAFNLSNTLSTYAGIQIDNDQQKLYIGAFTKAFGSSLNLAKIVELDIQTGATARSWNVMPLATGFSLDTEANGFYIVVANSSDDEEDGPQQAIFMADLDDCAGGITEDCADLMTSVDLDFQVNFVQPASEGMYFAQAIVDDAWTVFVGLVDESYDYCLPGDDDSEYFLAGQPFILPA